MFEGLGLFKRPLTTYNNEVPNNLINMSFHMFFSWKLYYMMQSMFPSTHHFLKYFSIPILYNVDVNTMAYVVDRAFELGTYIMDWSFGLENVVESVLGMGRVQPPTTYLNHGST